MTVRIFEWSSSISLQTLGTALNSRAGKSRVTNQVTSSLSRPPSPVEVSTPVDLQDYIDRYGEQVTNDAVADLRRYFQRTLNRGFTVGEIPTHLARLAIVPGDLRPSITAISVIGEGLAGWYMERRSLDARSRPIGESIDMIFRDASVSPRKYALVQVKATQQSSVIRQMKRAVPDLLQYSYNAAAMTQASYSCCIIGVIIKESDDYDIMSLEIELV